MQLKYENVNDAFRGLVEKFHKGEGLDIRKTWSRNGEVLAVQHPVVVTYEKPWQRVLLNRARDCNPFFHLYESLWMLAGRNDVAPLSYYSSKIGEIASDDGETFNGAYGYRWRNYPRRNDDDEYVYGAVDQLDTLIDHLRKNPNSRRAVLQMWNVEDDLLKIDSSKDVCCNLSVVFSVESGVCPTCGGAGVLVKPPEGKTLPAFNQANDGIVCPNCAGFPRDVPLRLHMTVFNRSNDLIWGMLGANVVHFSFLQEYVACSLGLSMGQYHQVSSNLHVYTDTNSGWKPRKWLSEYGMRTMHSPPDFPYDRANIVPILENREVFDKEVREFVNIHKHKDNVHGPEEWKEEFLSSVAEPMCQAFHMHKHRDYDAARYWVNKVVADDWRTAAQDWIEKRERKRETQRKGRKRDTE